VVDLGSQHDAIDLQTDVLAYFTGDDFIVAGEDLDGDARLGEIPIASAALSFGGSRKAI